MAKKAQTDIKTEIVIKALSLAEEQGWAHVTLADIAQACELSLPALFDVVEDKGDILVLLGKMIDRKTLEAVGEPDSSLAARDQLVDILMERFEVLNEYRGGVVAILESFKFDPKEVVISAPYVCRSMTWILEAAGMETSGIRGALKVTGLTGLYFKTLRVWKSDDSADLAKVMAALDKDLGRAEQVANTLGF